MGVYIARLDRSISGFSNWHPTRYGDDDSSHGIESVDEDEITLGDLFNLDGQAVSRSCSIEEENVLQSDAFDDVPNEEDYDRQHGFVTHMYRKTVSSGQELTVSWSDRI